MKLLRFQMLLCGVVASSLVSAAGPVRLPYLDKSDPPVAVIYTVPGYARPPQGRETEFYQVHVALWQDGRVMWSANPPGYGYPYYEGRIDTEQVNGFLRQADAVSSSTRSYESYIILDAKYVVMDINTGTSFTLSSSHPYFDKTRVNVRSTGISAKTGDPVPPDADTDKEKQFQQFVQEFDALQSSLESLAPETTTSAARKVKFKWARE